MTLTRIPVMPRVAVLALGLALAFGVGCDSRTGDTAAVGSQDAQAALPESVQIAVAVAKDLEAEPDDVEAVLERHGLDVERFEAMMYEISSDPLLSKAYNAALE